MSKNDRTNLQSLRERYGRFARIPMPECPADCPNRKSPADTSRGKFAAYAFALICSSFLAFQCVSYERRNEEVPVMLWMPSLLLIGTALGVNIEPGAIAKIITLRQ